jgi:Fe-S cluster assembly ATPase SufC
LLEQFQYILKIIKEDLKKDRRVIGMMEYWNSGITGGKIWRSEIMECWVFENKLCVV